MLYEFDHQQIQDFITTEPSDEELMARVQDRDEAALNVIYRRHAPLLRTIIGRVVNNSHDVDDLLDEALLEVWNRSASYDRTKGKPLGWMVTMARRRAIDKVRRRQAYERAEERLRLATEKEGEATCVAAGDNHASASERAEMLQRVLQTLPEAQSEVVKLAFYSGLSQREIAARTGLPLGTIKTRIELGLRKLRTAIATLGGAEEWSFAQA